MTVILCYNDIFHVQVLLIQLMSLVEFANSTDFVKDLSFPSLGAKNFDSTLTTFSPNSNLAGKKELERRLLKLLPCMTSSNPTKNANSLEQC